MRRDHARRPRGVSPRRPLPGERLRGPWYVVWGARTLAMGLLGAVVLAVALLIGACYARFAEVAVPGSVDVWLAPGAYTVVYDYPGKWVPPEVHFTLTDVETGQAVLFQPPAMTETVTVLDRRTDSLYDVEIERAGIYRLAVQYAPGAAPADVVLALGRGPGDRFQRLLATVGVGVAGGALWVGVVVLLSRYFHPRRR